MHDLYGQALQGSGNIDGAIAQFKQSVALDPKQPTIAIELAAALEKKGDWVASLDQYHKAALADASIDYRNKIIRSDAPDPQKEYAAAQLRYSSHIASLKAKGKASEVAALEARVHASQAAPNLSAKLDEALQAGAKAASERRFDQACVHYQEAVKLAEQLQPHDQRLATALDSLGNQYVGQDFAAADAAYSHELKVVQEIYGPQSFQVTHPLESLGTSAFLQRDYPTAQKYYSRAVELNEKFFGEENDKVAESLRILSRVYLAQKQFDKAESILLRAVKIDESLFGRDGIGMLLPLSTLCSVYDNWGKPDKSEPCNRQLLAVLEKQYGENNLQTVPVLKSQAQALRALGRVEEAARVEEHIKTIQATAMNQN
jgi:Tetratricopeptide repeat